MNLKQEKSDHSTQPSLASKGSGLRSVLSFVNHRIVPTPWNPLSVPSTDSMDAPGTSIPRNGGPANIPPGIGLQTPTNNREELLKQLERKDYVEVIQNEVNLFYEFMDPLLQCEFKEFAYRHGNKGRSSMDFLLLTMLIITLLMAPQAVIQLHYTLQGLYDSHHDDDIFAHIVAFISVIAILSCCVTGWLLYFQSTIFGFAWVRRVLHIVETDGNSVTMIFDDNNASQRVNGSDSMASGSNKVSSSGPSRPVSSHASSKHHSEASSRQSHRSHNSRHSHNNSRHSSSHHSYHSRSISSQQSHRSYNSQHSSNNSKHVPRHQPHPPPNTAPSPRNAQSPRHSFFDQKENHAAAYNVLKVVPSVSSKKSILPIDNFPLDGRFSNKTPHLKTQARTCMNSIRNQIKHCFSHSPPKNNTDSEPWLTKRRILNCLNTVFMIQLQLYFIMEFLRIIFHLNCFEENTDNDSHPLGYQYTILNMLGNDSCYTNTQHHLQTGFINAYSLQLFLLPFIFIKGLPQTRIRVIWLNFIFAVIAFITTIVLNDAYNAFPSGIVWMLLTFFAIRDFQVRNMIIFLSTRNVKETMVSKNKELEENHANEMRALIANVAHDLKTVSWFALHSLLLYGSNSVYLFIL